MIHKFLVTSAAVMISMAAFSATAHASLITNGGFETPVLIGSPGFVNIAVGGEGGAGFTGWTVTTNSVDVIKNGVLGTTATVYEGVQALDLVGFGLTGGVSQSFATAIGATYTLAFAYANNPISTLSASASVNMSDINGSLLSTSVTHSTSTQANFNWTLFSQTFVASANSTTLSFSEIFNSKAFNNGGVLLDGVSVELLKPAAVPEPAGLTLAGLGAVGMVIGAYRRRRQQQAAV